MRYFHPGNRASSSRNALVYARTEIAYTLADFSAAALFTAGSVLLFFEGTEPATNWAFTVGSLLFMTKPAIRAARELYFYLNGDVETLARRMDV